MIKNYICIILLVCVIKNCYFENKYLVEYKVYFVKYMFRENWYISIKKRLIVLWKKLIWVSIFICIDIV